MRKEKEKKILPTLKFMLKTAVKNKPQLFIAYVLQIVVSFSQTMVKVGMVSLYQYAGFAAR